MHTRRIGHTGLLLCYSLMCSETVEALLAGLQGHMTHAEVSVGVVPTMQQALSVASPLA